MNQDRIEGSAKEFGGKIESAAGKLVGDTDTNLEGRFRQAEGSVQNAVGQAQDVIGSAAQSATAMASDTYDRAQRSVAANPTTGLLIAAAVGLMLGWVMRSSVGR